MPPPRPIPRQNISAAYKDAGIEPRNIVWGWSARDEGRGVIALQVWQDEKFSPNHVLGKPVPLARRYLVHTNEDFERWKAKLKNEKPPRDVDDLLGWRYWLEDLNFARETGAAVGIIYCQPGQDAQGRRFIQVATYRPDLIGRVTHVDAKRGEYEVALLPVT